MRAQAALEYLIILAAMIFIITPIIFLANQNASSQRTSSEMLVAAETIAAAADSVYAQGPGAVLTVRVFFPSEYSAPDSFVSDKAIFLKHYSSGKLIETYRFSKAQLKGKLPDHSGFVFVKLSMTEQGYVLVGDAKVLTTPAAILLQRDSGSSDNVVVLLENYFSQPLTLSLVYSGPDWISLNSTSLGTLSPGQNASVLVSINVPAQAVGTYSGNIDVRDSSSGESYATLPIRITVPVKISSTTINTYKAIYMRGESATAYGTVYDQNSQPAGGMAVSVYFYNTSGSLEYATSSTTNSSGIFVASYFLSSTAPQGVWKVNATAGGKNASANFNVSTETVPPSVIILTPTASQALNTSGVRITANFSDTSTVTCKTQMDAGSWFDMNGGGVPSGTAELTYHGVSDGSHTSRVNCTDAAGNSNASSVSFTVNATKIIYSSYDLQVTSSGVKTEFPSTSKAGDSNTYKYYLHFNLSNIPGLYSAQLNIYQETNNRQLSVNHSKNFSSSDSGATIFADGAPAFCAESNPIATTLSSSGWSTFAVTNAISECLNNNQTLCAFEFYRTQNNFNTIRASGYSGTSYDPFLNITVE